MAGIQTVLSRSVTKTSQSSTFETDIEKAVKKNLTEPRVMNNVAIHVFDTPAITVPVAKFVKNEVEQHSLENAKLNQYPIACSEPVMGYRTQEEDEFKPEKMESEYIYIYILSLTIL